MSAHRDGALVTLIVFMGVLPACRPTPGAPPARLPLPDGPVTTEGAIAIHNLDRALAKIEEYRKGGHEDRLGESCELLLTRGQFEGRIADYEKAQEIGERLVALKPHDAAALLVRARTRGALHGFAKAAADLDAAEALGADSAAVAAARASLFQAVGRFEEALALRRRLSADRPDVMSIGAEAVLLAEMGRREEADRRFAEARAVYRDTSPFPLAWLDFHRGRVALSQGRLQDARAALLAAHERLPQYVAATGHLGEVEDALGHHDRAVVLLTAAAKQGDDPDPAGHLARVLAAAGRPEEAEAWRLRAERRFEELLVRHPDAFADHAAEFYLAVGGDPARALVLALQNETLRPTPLAAALVRRAREAIGRGRGRA